MTGRSANRAAISTDPTATRSPQPTEGATHA